MCAIYKGLKFKTPLEARWAAFFDLAGWDWHVNPVNVGDWSPDFWVSFPCSHSECSEHTLLVAVLPFDKVDDFMQHPCLKHAYQVDEDPKGIHKLVDAGAAFGTNPEATFWVSSHGSGGGTHEVPFFVHNADKLWLEADDLILS